MRVLLLLVALAGCDRVFGLGDPYEDAPGTGTGDAHRGDGPAMPADASGDADGRLPTPLLHYRFDGTMAEAGGGAMATCTTSVGAACGYAPGKYGMALHLDGSSIAEITLPSLPPSFTVIAWVNYAASGPVFDLSQALASSSEVWSLDFSDMILFSTQSNTGSGVSGAVRPTETWTSVAMTFGAGDVQYLYTDLIATSPVSVGTLAYGANSVLCVGCRLSQTPTQYFTGAIDDVYVFDRVLTQAEISAYASSAH
ncbi:MAG TPA: LamG domain-containing protein [Kofleriaceae bacterium]|nr:LamG domain-containing protein [Kofleriaceae bacterium]